MKKRILILGNSASGLYDFRNELLVDFLKQYDVYVSLPDGEKVPQLAQEGCHVMQTALDRRGMNPVRDLKLFVTYHRLMKEIKPDAVLTYTIKPNIYGSLASRINRVPYYVNITGLGSAFENGGMVQKLVVFLYKMALKGARCVFFQNEHNQSVFERLGIHGQKSRRLPGSGVSLSRHCQEPFFSHDSVQFLFVGRIMKEKGIEEFLYAAKKCHKDYEHAMKCEDKPKEKDITEETLNGDIPKPVFRIIGKYEEDYAAVMEPLVSEGIVELLPYQMEMHPFYTEADVVVVPSYHEGMSNVLLEASATGRPVIASNIPGCREAFTEGITGYGCESRSAESFYQAVRKMLALTAEKRQSMGQAARKKMEQEFDRQLIIQAYREELFRDED